MCVEISIDGEFVGTQGELKKLLNIKEFPINSYSEKENICDEHCLCPVDLKKLTENLNGIGEFSDGGLFYHIKTKIELNGLCAQLLSCPKECVEEYRNYMIKYRIPFKEIKNNDINFILQNSDANFILPVKYRPHAWKLNTKKGLKND